MMRTLRDMNMSKFVAEDVPLFISLVEDLFPAQKADRAHFPEISAALEKVRHRPCACKGVKLYRRSHAYIESAGSPADCCA